MRIIHLLLLSLLICSNGFCAYKQVYNSQTGLPDFVGVQASGDIGLVCTSGQVLTTTGSGAWKCGSASGSGITGLTADSGGTTTGSPVTLAGTGTVTTARSGDTITITGSSSASVSTVVAAGNYNLTTSNDVVVINTASAQFTATLPTAVGATKIYTVKRSGANNVTVATTLSQTIDGDLTQILVVDKTSLDLVSDNSNWRIK